MSRENVETIQAGFDAWNAGDMNAFVALYDPEATLWMTADWPEPGPFVGREAILRQSQQLRDTFDAEGLEPISEFVDQKDHVVVRQIWRAAGHGPETAIESTSVFRMRDGLVVEHRIYGDHAEALAAAGLTK